MTGEALDNGLFQINKLQAPADVIGQIKKAGGYTKTNPREWTDSEIQWIKERKKDGYSNSDIALALGRSQISLQLKLKRLAKSSDNYNLENRPEKYAANFEFLNLIQPSTVLDVYAGNSWWKSQGVTTTTNDKDTKFDADYHLDALDLLCHLKLEGKKYDIVDLDPYGSAYDQFDLALMLAKKGLIVSFGEWGHKRWKRVDFVKPRYGIENLEGYGQGEAFVLEVQRIAACNKKEAEPVVQIHYANFVRVYFKLTEIKITEQWDEK